MKTKNRAVLSLTAEQLKAQQKQARTEKQKQAKETGIARNARGQWIKGQSGNDLGRPRSALADLCRQQVTKHGLVDVLGSIAARTGQYAAKSKLPITVSDQINAIRLLLLYGYGAPKNDIDTGDVKIEVTYADNRAVNITHAARGAEQDHNGVQTLQRAVLRPEVWEDNAGNGSSDSPGSAG